MNKHERESNELIGQLNNELSLLCQLNAEIATNEGNENKQARLTKMLPEHQGRVNNVRDQLLVLGLSKEDIRWQVKHGLENYLKFDDEITE